MFKSGDRVVCSARVGELGLTNQIGTVLCERKGGYHVQYDNWIKGHSSAGAGVDGHCYWNPSGDFTLLPTEETPNMEELLKKHGVIREGLTYHIPKSWTFSADSSLVDSKIGLVQLNNGVFRVTSAIFVDVDHLDKVILSLIDLRNRWDAGERP